MAFHFREEGVTSNEAKILDISVKSEKGPKFAAKCFQRTPKEIPKKALPSPQYLDMIVKGALQNGIPDEYFNQLRGYETNQNTKEIPAYTLAMKKLFGKA